MLYLVVPGKKFNTKLWRNVALWHLPVNFLVQSCLEFKKYIWKNLHRVLLLAGYDAILFVDKLMILMDFHMVLLLHCETLHLGKYQFRKITGSEVVLFMHRGLRMFTLANIWKRCYFTRKTFSVFSSILITILLIFHKWCHKSCDLPETFLEMVLHYHANYGIN